MNSVIITGARCVGKTSIGKKVSEILNIPFFDADNILFYQYGSISAIVENEGWTAFRRCENSVLRDIVSKIKKPVVLSPGGGAVSHSENISWTDKSYDELTRLRKSNVLLLRNFGTNYFVQQNEDLEVSAKIQTQRLLQDSASAEQRPSLTENSSQYLEMLSILKARLPFYVSAADFVVTRNDMNIDETAKYIVNIHS